MSVFRKTGVRCDWCGKFSMHPTGEYTKPDGVSAGCIQQPEWERNRVDASGKHAPIDSDQDICEECAADCCTFCGSDQLVRITPMTPGPTGWGYRCKACGQRWDIPTPVEQTGE
jgi:hypothetical protein